ncbi:mRNA cleavage and polyadenylation specificity factor poly(A) polymerase Pla1 [Schizosaccharomyces pombe]|uniref:Poly(A) polymerase pla1 n=3 Tax=Schizosaccharomyces pombe (strain 972 / ATCC 24843) TaxID=284812 RepID=PAP_SCHPO|nr:poly(A) polymerase Pla1 [Schizosaccharomyces pombe]Q10295.1 RecName: Full=Poly(A) polymerase pla1; Short=PAP; AltName: Full=Polynucleotide adenylyltransferase [Schizosaccharomyces pombe 972h-]CAA22808.1 poly(A) polymerase Pla1 [Schizosaccharomyces pombe]CAA56141.1 polymerase [Schizosaccharomyces pombe]|eukprot:NP_595362.1 poly(A) polymerase Pla1 [Schizosaccharomyces pombe]
MTTKQWGITPPISTAPATEQENALNTALINELKNQNLFESPAESEKRVKVLDELQQITTEFVKKVSLAKHMNEKMANEAGGKIFTYGSYRLGVYGPGSDIDTLVVVPKHVSRDNFFQDLEPMLREREEVTDLAAVPDAYVPIIKFKFLGISIDLIFARLSVPRVPRDLELSDNNLLKGVEERCVLSLNGTRVTDQILQLVPNRAVFKHALRAIKFWAQRRAIYANVVGFPGGVAWAMMVARICQLYPNAVSSVIVAKFFRILHQWNWPQPILLKPIEDGPLQVRIWNPKLYPSDKAHRMPIITPAYPSMCATHNITLSTQTIILREMVRAGEIADQIMVKALPWSALFQKHDFFHRYKHYLTITAAAKTAEAQLKWAGLVESKLRHLVTRLELVDAIALAHPFNKGFDKVYNCSSEEEAQQVASGVTLEVAYESTDHEKLANDTVNEEKADNTESKADGSENGEKQIFPVYTTTCYIGLELEKKKGHPIKRLDISWPTQEFYELCKKWDKYDDTLMNVFIKNTKNTALPDEVFEPGEERPKATKKRSTADTAHSTEQLKRQKVSTA